MQCDNIIITFILAGIVLFMDSVSGSRPARPVINRMDYDHRLSVSEAQKVQARWNAAYYTRISDDEDLVVDDDIGSGSSEMQGDDPGVSNINIQPTLTESFPEVSCCNLGKLVGSRGRRCNMKYNTIQLKLTKTRQNNNAFKTNQRQIGIIRPFTFKDILAYKYHKCSLKEFGDFYKCCNAEYFNYRRKVRRLRQSKLRYRHRGRQTTRRFH